MRTFVAIELPEDLKEKIGQFEKEIGRFIHLRLVAPKNLHLTLFFLDEVEEARLPEVVEAVKTGTEGIKPFFLFLGKPEFFSHGLWFEIEGQLEVLKKLYQQISEELKRRNFKLEERAFSAHITIGRSKSKSKSKRFEFGEKVNEKFKVDSVGIFTSRLTPQGPIYSKIARTPLEKNKEINV